MTKFRTALALSLAAGVSLLTPPVFAEGLRTSVLPKPRPAAAIAKAPDLALKVTDTGGIVAITRPQPRPADLAARYVATLAQSERPASEAPVIDEGSAQQVAAAIPSVLRPRARPSNLDTSMPGREVAPVVKAAAVRTLPGKQAVMSQKGSVCGDPAIRGETLAPITSRVKGCGIEAPVKVTAISGVKFSTPATVSCEAAVAFKKWIDRGIQPAFDNQVVGLHIAGSYVCRPRNGVKGAKVSEHGRGRAIDVMGFTLASGRQLSVLKDYRGSKAIKAAHRAACGPFGTTLGPGSDGHHEDHLHVDIVSYRNGTYCR